jgi:hypothetical protein
MITIRRTAMDKIALTKKVKDMAYALGADFGG